MDENDRISELNKIVDTIDGEKAGLLRPIVENIVYMETRLRELRALPQIRIDKRNPSRQQATPAAKLYKETMQSYTNAVKILLTALYRQGGNGADELIEKLKEFEIEQS